MPFVAGIAIAKYTNVCGRASDCGEEGIKQGGKKARVRPGSTPKQEKQTREARSEQRSRTQMNAGTVSALATARQDSSDEAHGKSVVARARARRTCSGWLRARAYGTYRVELDLVRNSNHARGGWRTRDDCVERQSVKHGVRPGRCVQ